MTARVRHMLLTLVSGSALAIAPMAIATVVTPAASNADECSAAGAAEGTECGERDRGLNCPDGTVVDEENGQVRRPDGGHQQAAAGPACTALVVRFRRRRRRAGLGGFPSLGTINAPDLVLPSIGVGLVPDIPIILQPNIGWGGRFASRLVWRALSRHFPTPAACSNCRAEASQDQSAEPAWAFRRHPT